MPHAVSNAVLDQIVSPVVRHLSTDAARALLAIRASKPAARRMAYLARKCNEGELSPQQRVEYETNVVASEFLALLQVEARALLAEKVER